LSCNDDYDYDNNNNNNNDDDDNNNNSNNNNNYYNNELTSVDRLLTSAPLATNSLMTSILPPIIALSSGVTSPFNTIMIIIIIVIIIIMIIIIIMMIMIIMINSLQL